MYDSLRIIFAFLHSRRIRKPFPLVFHLPLLFHGFASPPFSLFLTTKPLTRPSFLLPSRSASALCTPILPQDRPLVKAGSRGKFRHRMLYPRASCAKGLISVIPPVQTSLLQEKFFFYIPFGNSLDGEVPGPCVLFKRDTRRKGYLLDKCAIQTAFHLSHCRPRKGSNCTAYKDKSFPKSGLKEEVL